MNRSTPTTRRILLTFAAFGLVVAVNGAVLPGVEAVYSTKDLVAFDGLAFAPCEIRSSDGPAHSWNDSSNQR